MQSGYDAVMKLENEDAQWLNVVRACHEFALKYGNHFSGKWISGSPGVGWFPSLRPLVTRGILEKEYSNASGRKAYYRLIDQEGVGRALDELGMLRTINA